MSAVDLDNYPTTDDEVAEFARSVGAPGLLDIHVHGLPERLQQAVWRFFDRLDSPPWPIEYRDDEAARLRTLGELGVIRHTALAYAHQPGVAAWCNEHTLALAEQHEQVVPTFTFFPEPDVEDYVASALSRGGRVAKVHLQVSRLDPLDPSLHLVWSELERLRVPVVLHAAAVYGVEGGEAWCGPDPVRRLLDAHPDLRLVIAHLGGPDFEPFLDLAAEGAVWLDHAMALMDPPFLMNPPPGVMDRVAQVQDRLLFGSDFPSVPHPVVAQVRGLAPLQLTAAQLAELFHHRAARLLDQARPDRAPAHGA